MAARNRRSTFWFWILLVALVLTVVVGVRFVTTAEDCGDGPKSWQWFPPEWVCGADT